jgi:DNA repair exonuclease SbcCD nuclease subunit
MKAVITADWHLRADRPRCRLDDDWEALQESIVGYVVAVARKCLAPLVIVGDVFDTPTVPHRIVSMFLKHVDDVDDGVFVLPGQHDLPYHQWKNVDASAFGNLWTLTASPWQHATGIRDVGALGSRELWGDPPLTDTAEILFLHTLVFPTAKDLPPNVEARTAAELLADYPKARWIFTGDYHRAFHYEKAGRHVVNPGCITRQAADFKDYVPQAWIVDTDAGTVEAVQLPDTEEMVTDEYLRREEEREERISAFVETVKKSEGLTLDFLANVEAALAKNKKTLKAEVVQAIRELIEAGKE